MAALTGLPVTIYSGTSVPYYNQIFHEVRHVSSDTIAVGGLRRIDLGSTGRLVVFEATLEYPYGS